MYIERFKRLSIPKSEAGKMTEVVRDVIKQVKTNKQNVYEKTSEDLKPLKEKFDKEIEEISKLRDEVNKLVVPSLPRKLVTGQGKGKAMAVSAILIYFSANTNEQ